MFLLLQWSLESEDQNISFYENLFFYSWFFIMLFNFWLCLCKSNYIPNMIFLKQKHLTSHIQKFKSKQSCKHKSNPKQTQCLCHIK